MTTPVYFFPLSGGGAPLEEFELMDVEVSGLTPVTMEKAFNPAADEKDATVLVTRRFADLPITCS